MEEKNGSSYSVTSEKRHWNRPKVLKTTGGVIPSAARNLINDCKRSFERLPSKGFLRKPAQDNNVGLFQLFESSCCRV